MAGMVGVGAVGADVVPVEVEAALLRTAYLLTGDRRAAEELLTDALADAWRSRHRTAAGDGAVATVRRALVRRSLRRPARTRPSAPGWTAENAGVPPAGLPEEVRTTLLGLPARARAALVLRLHDELTETETAEALGCSPAAVAALTGVGTAALLPVVAGAPPPLGSPPLPTPAPAPPAPSASPPEGGAPGDPDAIYRRPS